MSKTKRFFKDIIFYSGSNLFSNILNFITGIIIRKVLQPGFMGLFNELMLVFDYARYAQLGVIDALDRELPYFYGKKDAHKVKELKDVGFTFCLGVALLIGICLFVFSFVYQKPEDRLFVNGVRIVSLLVALQLFNSFYTVLNRSKNNFSVISSYTILIAFLDVGAKVLLVIKFGLYGLLAASALTWALGLIYFHKASGERLSLAFNFPVSAVLRLFKIGFPIFLTGLVYMTLKNIDRIMIIKLMDRESLGFYTIALMVSVYIVQLPNMVYAVIFPRFYQAYGEKQSIFEIKDLFIKPTMVFAYLFPILAGFSILVLPLLVHYILPAYMPGLLPAYLLLLGSCFLTLINMPGYLLIALNKQVYMIAIGLLCIMFGAALNYLFVRKIGIGLQGIAIGTSISFFLYATILTAFAFRNYTKAAMSHVKLFIELYLPIAWVTLLLFTLHIFTIKVYGMLLKDIAVVLIKESVFLIGCIPLVLYVNKKTAVFSLIKGTYFKKG